MTHKLNVMLSFLKGEMVSQFKKLIVNNTDDALIAYNVYQENCHFGVDYIFNAHNDNDWKCCVNGGLTYLDASRIYEKIQVYKATPYFFFGENYNTPSVIESTDDLITIIANHAEEIIDDMLLNPRAYPQNIYDAVIGSFFALYGK